MVDISNFIRLVLIRIFLALLILSIIIKVAKEKFIAWLHGQNSDSGMSVLTRGYMLSDISTTKLCNNAVITDFQPSNSNIYGNPIRITVSSTKCTKFCVLRDVTLSSFHDALIGDHNGLRDYIVANAVEKYTVKPGSQEMLISVSVQSSADHGKRETYSLVIGLLSGASDSSVEEINVTCYIIHVKIRAEESVDTSIMYTFWKTNWNRLLTPQVLFNAGQNANSEEQTTMSVKTVAPNTLGNDDNACKIWRPCCFICLSSETTSSLRVLLPCRHAAICPDCFKSLQKSAMSAVPHHLIGLLSCPLCRTPVSSTLSLPPVTECMIPCTSDIGDDVIGTTTSHSCSNNINSHRHGVLSY
ncbi:unnamed protein product [Heterobilharzia americana]|nr:unnamed protein product [Heterobilharzia americana]